MKTVHVHLYSQSEPITIEEVDNTYTKDGLFCVLRARRPTRRPIAGSYEFFMDRVWFETPERVDKFPVQHIFRIVEETR